MRWHSLEVVEWNDLEVDVEAFSLFVEDLEHREGWEEDLSFAGIVGEPLERDALMATSDLVLDLGHFERQVEG